MNIHNGLQPNPSSLQRSRNIFLSEHVKVAKQLEEFNRNNFEFDIKFTINNGKLKFKGFSNN